ENFGAFVDVGGAEGLVHLTELSWKHITHPRQALSVGDEVDVKVINIDPKQNRIGLSIKQIQPDPWDEIAALYANGVLVKGTVTKLTKFGAFARIHGEISVEGLIHISELSDSRVEHPRDVVKRNDVLTLRVVKVDVKNRRLGLSLKRVNSAEFLDSDMDRAFIEASRIMERREEEAARKAEEDARAAAEAELAAESAPEVVEEVAEDAVETVENTADAVEETAAEVVESVEETAEDVSDTVEDAVEDAAEDASDTVEDAVEDAENVVEKAVETVSEVVEDVVDAVEDVVEDIVEAITGSDNDDDDSESDDD
ncbi:MAG: S1 RNA-binding domain-containing protein, partial [Aggregatilineales bacterium]